MPLANMLNFPSAADNHGAAPGGETIIGITRAEQKWGPAYAGTWMADMVFRI
jgi:hypothetical protein